MSLGVKAIVFAGSVGKYLVPVVTDEFPKPLLPVANRPMIFYSLFSLLRSGIRDITIVASSIACPQIADYVNGSFFVDPRVNELKLHPQGVSVRFLETEESFDTADVLRKMPKTDADYIVMSCDYVGDIDLEETFQTHRAMKASCTITMLETASTKHEADTYALVEAKGKRLLGLYFRSDLDAGVLKVRGTLLEKFPSLQLRSNVIDTHIYMFSPWVLNELLEHREAISSVKFDLVPYLARRQFTLARCEELHSNEKKEVVVCARIAKSSSFAIRANTIESVMQANIAVSKGALDPYLPSALSKDKNANAKKLAKKGDKTSVSVDSVIGSGVTTGDRTSVKKSAVGDGVSLGAQVKLNGCVIGNNVTICDNVNLSSTFVAFGASVKAGCKLKDCQVAPGFSVPVGTEATNQTFSVAAEQADDSDLGDLVSFA